MGCGWSDKTKVILNSTQFKFKLKLKLELSLAKIVHIPPYRDYWLSEINSVFVGSAGEYQVMKMLFSLKLNASENIMHHG